MPPLPMYPNRPTGAPDTGMYPSGSGGYDTSGSYAGGLASGQSSGNVSSQQYDQEMQWVAQQIANLANGSSGYSRYALQQQYADAQKGRDNALALERMRDQQSRYGTDKDFQARMAQLEQNAQQFDANHELDQQKFGLSVAQAYTSYAQTPDQVWAMNDFKDAVGHVGLGQGPGAIAGEASQPTPKSWQDFAALSGYGGLPGVQQGQSGGMPQMAGGGGAASGGGAGGSGTDPRLTAANAVMKAIPPSGDPGTSGQDYAALNAIHSLYFAAKPGSVEQLGAPRQKIAMAGLARLGYDPNLVQDEYTRSLPGQGSARMA